MSKEDLHADNQDFQSADDLDLNEFTTFEEEEDSGVPLDQWLEEQQGSSDSDDKDSGKESGSEDEEEEDDDAGDGDEDEEEDQEDDDDEDDDEFDDDFVGDALENSPEGKKAFKGAVDSMHESVLKLIKSKDKEGAAKKLEELVRTKPKLAEAVAKEFKVGDKRVESADQLIRKLRGQKEGSDGQKSYEQLRVAKQLNNLKMQNFVRDKLDQMEGVSYKDFKQSKASKVFVEKCRSFLEANVPLENFIEDVWKLATIDDQLKQSYKQGLKAKKKAEAAKSMTPGKKTKTGTDGGKKYGKHNLLTREEYFALDQNEAVRYKREAGNHFRK